MTTYKIAARPQEIEVTACTRVLMGCMQRLVLNKDIAALREFHRMGIPLDYALDFSVQKGSMPLIEELLNNLGVLPSETTLLRAMQRGLMIRNMFLARVTPTVRHVNSAVFGENYDTANILLDRRIELNQETVGFVKASAKSNEERKLFIDRLIATLDQEHLRNPAVLRKMALWTTVAQFERAMDRVGEISKGDLNRLVTDCLRAAAPGHVRAVLNRGAQFLPEHLDVAGDGTWTASDNNPKGEWGPVLSTVLETSIEEKCLFQGSDDVHHLVRPLVEKYAFTPATHPEFMRYCELLAKACSSDARAQVGRFIMTEAGRKRLNQRLYTLEDVNNLIDALRPVFTRDVPVDTATDYEPGVAP